MPAKPKKAPASNSNSNELTIAVSGKIISSNFEEFRSWALEQIEAINLDLKTDEEFGQAVIDAKTLKSFEETLTVKEEQMLQELDDVYSLITGTRALKEISRENRLKLEKTMKSKREEVIGGMITAGLEKLSLVTPVFRSKLTEAVKNKRSLTLMNEAVDKAVKDINQLLSSNEEIIAKVETEHGEILTFGRNALLVMETEALKVEVERRIERMKADRERQRLQDEADKLRQEAAAEKAAAEKSRKDALAGLTLYAEKAIEEIKQDPSLVRAPMPPPPEPEIETLFGAAPPSSSETPADEAERFIALAKQCFGPLKVAREGLRHKANIQAAKSFAGALGEAWGAFVEEVSA